MNTEEVKHTVSLNPYYQIVKDFVIKRYQGEGEFYGVYHNGGPQVYPTKELWINKQDYQHCSVILFDHEKQLGVFIFKLKDLAISKATE